MKASFQRGSAALGHDVCGGGALVSTGCVHERDAVAALGLVHEVGGDEDGDLCRAGTVPPSAARSCRAHRVHARGGLVQISSSGWCTMARWPATGAGACPAATAGQRCCGRPAGQSAPAFLHALGHPASGTWNSRACSTRFCHRQLRCTARTPVTYSPRGGVAMSRGPDWPTARPASLGGQQAGEHLHGGGGLPQPLEPRKPKISPRRMRKLTWSTATKSPKRIGQALAPDGDFAAASACRVDDHRLVPAPLGLGQQGDEGGFQVAGVAVRCISSAGVPVARTGLRPWPPASQNAGPSSM